MTFLWKKLLEITREGEGAGGGGGAGAGAGAGAGDGGGAKPWYDGKLDAELIGHIENKGWKKDDPIEVAVQATKAARELQKHFGVPAEQLIKLPKDAADEAGMKAVFERLGVPKEAKDYEFSTIKHADGRDVEQGLTDALRAAALNARVPKDRAADVLKAVVKHMDDAATAQAGETAARLKTERTALAKEWGTTPEQLKASENMLTAKQGARRLGVDTATVDALENVVGYAKIMEMFRKIGAGTSEDTFVDTGHGGSPTTRNGAIARKEELMADTDWAKRYLKGGAAEVREMNALNELIAG